MLEHSCRELYFPDRFADSPFAMERLPRDPIRFDLVNAFAEFGCEEKVSLRDPATATDGFVERTRESVRRSLSNEALLHGLRTQSMFEALLVSLGAVELLKQEDAGEIYAFDETLEVPDFRLVLRDGSQLLVEVKNFYQTNNARKSFEVDEEYLEGLIRYSTTMRCDLFFAIYWVKWNVWTLVPPDVFQFQGNKRSLDLLDAMKANHMASLGDYAIGTRFPLSFVMYADTTKPRSIGPDQTGTFTVANVEVYCAGHRITDLVEMGIATYLMFYGKWEYEAELKLAANEIEAVEHRWVPDEDHQQGFEIVGSLSELFSTFYRFRTQEEGELTRLRLDVTPGFLGQLIPEDHKGHNLPLWRFRLQPSSPC